MDYKSLRLKVEIVEEKTLRDENIFDIISARLY